MQARRKKYRLAIAALLATVVAAPTAYAMPAEPSTAQKHAVAHQDLRAEGSIPGSRVEAATQDVRWEDSIVPSSRNELPIVAAAPQPVPGDGDGIEWPIALVALTGAFALGGWLALAAQRLRTQTNPAH